MAGATMASPACARIMGRTITRPSSMIPKAIGSKPTTGGNSPWRPSDPKSKRALQRATSGRRSATSARCIRDLSPALSPIRNSSRARAIVTFVNGAMLREPIVTLDEEARRLVWTHEGGRARHYNGALQVSELAGRLDLGCLDRRFPARRHRRFHVEGDRSGNGGDAAVPRPARGLAKTSRRRREADEAALHPDRFTPTLRKEQASR